MVIKSCRRQTCRNQDGQCGSTENVVVNRSRHPQKHSVQNPTTAKASTSNGTRFEVLMDPIPDEPVGDATESANLPTTKENSAVKPTGNVAVKENSQSLKGKVKAKVVATTASMENLFSHLQPLSAEPLSNAKLQTSISMKKNNGPRIVLKDVTNELNTGPSMTHNITSVGEQAKASGSHYSLAQT